MQTRAPTSPPLSTAIRVEHRGAGYTQSEAIIGRGPQCVNSELAFWVRVVVRQIDGVVREMVRRTLERARERSRGHVNRQKPRIGIDPFVAGPGRGVMGGGAGAAEAATIFLVFVASSVPPHQNHPRGSNPASLRRLARTPPETKRYRHNAKQPRSND